MLRRFFRNVLRSAVLVVFALVARAHAGTVCDPSGPWRQELLLGGFSNEVEAVAWSPDGSQVAAGEDDGGMLALFDSQTGEQLRTFRTGLHAVASVAWSPDGAQLASGTGGNSRDKYEIWDPASGELIRELTELVGWAFSIAWSPDGSILMGSNGGGDINFWDNNTGALLRSLRSTPFTDYVWSLAWSPDGSQFIGGGGPWDHNGKVWDAESGTVNYLLAHEYIVYGVAWSPDGSEVATASGDHHAKTWDPSTGELLLDLDHGATVLSAAWSPDAAQLATSAFDGRIRIWGADSGELRATIAGTGRFAYSVGWSPDGNRVAFGSGTAVEIWTRCPKGVAR